MLCGAMLIGSWYSPPRKVKRPLRIRPAHGIIGYDPHPILSFDSVTSSSCPRSWIEESRPPLRSSTDTRTALALSSIAPRRYRVA